MTDSTWAQHPGLYEEAVELLKTRGYGEIAALFRARGIDVSRSAVRHKLQNRGLGPLVHAGKGAYIPQKLIEPRDGYVASVRTPPPVYPKGWEPRVERTGHQAECTTDIFTNPDTKPAELIASFGFDPKYWQISGDITCNKWQGHYPVETAAGLRDYEARWNFQYKFRIREKESVLLQVDVEDIKKYILSAKAPKVPVPEGDSAFAVVISDLQNGKRDNDGSGGIVNRFIERIEMVKDRVRDLRKTGNQLGTLYVFGLGDLVEQCRGMYPAQQFLTDLNLVDQIIVVQRLIVRALKEWSPLFEKVVVACVGGNHGEANRVDGKNVTDTADNFDVMVFRTAEDILGENQDAFGHVAFQIPRSSMDLTLDVCGTITAISHGHQFGNGATPTKKAEDWWKGQAHGEQPAGGARLLITGHLHSFQLNAGGVKTHIQAPAMEGGSNYWRDKTGQEAAKGLLTLVIGKDRGPVVTPGLRAGWEKVEVL